MFSNFFNRNKAKQVARNAAWNLGIVLWLGVVYFAANYIIIGLVYLWRALAPNAKVNELLFSQVIILSMWTIVFCLMFVLPKLISVISKKHAKNMEMISNKISVNPKRLGLSGWLTWSEVGLGITGFVLGLIMRLVFVIAVKQIFPSFNIEQRQDLGFDFGPTTDRLELILVFVMLVIIVPIIEELIFRGYLYGKIREHSGFFTTTMIVSLVFGLGHFNGGGWVAVVVTASLSVAMCLTREVSNSIYSSIIIHMINNGIAFIVLANAVLLK